MKWNMQELRRPRTSTHRRPIRKSRPAVERLETRLAPANVPILSGHYDNLLSGWNNQEEDLTPARVNDAGFGKLFNYQLDGYAYAQPLYMPGVQIGPNTYDVVFVATEHDTLYAFNAVSQTGGPDPANPGLLWKRSFIDPKNGITTMPSGDTFSGDIVPEVGITGTPIIDASTNILYVVAKTKEIRKNDPNPHYVQKLYGIDITTGDGKPVTIGDTINQNDNTTDISVPGTGAGSLNGRVYFNARKEHQRMSLQVVHNADKTSTVYVAYASHGDNGPYHGWVLGYNAADLSLQKVYNTSPNGSASGIWESGGNLGVDADNNLYFATGNGFGTGFNGNGGARALGAGGGALGYGNGSGQTPEGITHSVSVRFRNFPTETGLGTNANFGAAVPMPNYDFNRDSRPAAMAHTYVVTLDYDHTMTTLMERVHDNNDPARADVVVPYNINIPQTIGANTAWVGFTGGTGGLNVQQDVKTWVLSVGGNPVINHPSNFDSHDDLRANGNADFAGAPGSTVARVTTPNNGRAGSIFSASRVDMTMGFHTVFTFQMIAGSDPIADGMTFTIQAKDAGTDFAESVLRLSTTGTGQALPLTDFFTPVDWKRLDNADADLGSGGTLLLPDAVGSTAHPHLIVETGKTGRMYLMDRDHLGENVPTGTDDQILQTVFLTGGESNGVWGNPAFFQDGANTGLLYYWGSSTQGRAFRITSGVMNPTPASITPFTMGFPGAQPSISSNGMDGSTGIMWALRSDNYGSQGPESLFAFNAENVGQQLWSSTDVSGDAIGGTSVKFTFPIVTHGRVYAGSNGSLVVYGLLPAHTTAPAAPSNLQVAQVAPAQGGDTKLQLSWMNPVPNDATLIKIERATMATGPFTQIAQLRSNFTTYTDMGLAPLTHYWYRIRAANQAQPGDSPYSNTADNFTRLAAARLSATSVTSIRVDLSWNRVLNDPSGHYDIERSIDNFQTFDVVGPNLPATATTFSDTTVVRPTTYQYRVHAFATVPTTDQSISNVVVTVVGPLVFNYPIPPEGDGITSDAGLNANGSAQLLTGATQEHLIRLNNDFGQAGSVFTTNRVGVSKFENHFWIRLHEGTQPNPADGLTFTIQRNSPTALGGGGGGLGYQGIGNSMAVKFDVWNNDGETDNSTGIFFNGSYPSVPHGPGDVNIPLNPAIVNLRDQHRKRIDMNYDVATLVLNVTITDEQHDGGPTSVSQRYENVNLPAMIGGDAAYVGFTGGTGGAYSLQDVLGWVFPARAPGAPTSVQATSTGPQHNVTLTWSPTTTDEDGFQIERSRDNFHFTKVGDVGFGVTTFTDPNVPDGIHFYRVRAVNDQGSAASSSVQVTIGGTVVQVDHSLGFTDHSDLQANGNATFPVQPPCPTCTIGIFSDHTNIGTTGDPGTPGSASFGNGAYTLSASGSDVWDSTDHMHYLYRSMSGDGEVIARVTSLDNPDFWTKGGIMIRNNLTAGSPNAFMVETGHNFGHDEPVLQWRDNQDQGSGDFGQHDGPLQTAPVWLRLVRSGNTFSGFWAQDINNGQSHGDWNAVPRNGGNAHNVPGMGNNVLVGLGLTSHNNGQTATASFDHVSITQVARLTDGGGGQASSLFKTARVPVTGSFSTSYVMNIRPVNGSADGTAFVLQADPRGAAALGDSGGGIGYFGNAGIRNSIAIKFDLYSQGSHHATTGLFLNGNFDQSRQIDMTSAGIDFGQNHSYKVDLSYDGLALSEKLTDLVSRRVFSTDYNINLRQLIGSDTAFMGFTGGTGGETAVIDVQNWTATANTFVVPPHLIVAGFPSPATAGDVNTFNVTIRKADGSIQTGYRGTVHFSSTDPQAIVPRNYTFTAADAGSHIFGAVLFTAGTQSIIATDTTNPDITEQQDIEVVEGPSLPSGGRNPGAAFLVGPLAPASAVQATNVRATPSTAALPASVNSERVPGIVTPLSGNNQQFAVPGLKQRASTEAAATGDALGLALGEWVNVLHGPVMDNLIRARVG